MRFSKLSDGARQTFAQFLVPFTITFAVGLGALILYSRITSEGMATTPPANASANEVVKESGESDTGETGPTGEPARDGGSDWNDSVGTTRRSDFSTDHTNDDQSRMQPAANERENDGRFVTSLPLGSSRFDPAPRYQASLSAFASSGSLSDVPATRDTARNATPNSPVAAAPDPMNSPSEYPPRRIPWHQGFTLEQEWYRSWYGWAAFEAEQTAAVYQNDQP